MAPWCSGDSRRRFPTGWTKRQRRLHPVPLGRRSRRGTFAPVNPYLHRRSGHPDGYARARTIVSRPLPWVRKNDVRLHDGVQFLEVGRGGGVTVVDLLACVRVVGPKQRAVGARDLAGRRVRRDVESGVVVRLGAHCWFRFLLRIWRWPPAEPGAITRETTSGAAFMCANKRCDVARSLRPTIRCGRFRRSRSGVRWSATPG